MRDSESRRRLESERGERGNSLLLQCTRMCTTSLMVGLSEGFVAAHKIPSLNTLRISSKYFGSLIVSSRASSMGFPSWKWYRAQSAKLLSSSPSVGPLPVASSKRITPKLYTSVFSFTFLVCAYSGCPCLFNILARPKSAILALNSESKRILLDFTSL
nr:hypothetical protein ACMD2_09101 [Ipomoea batatas]